MMNGTGIMLPTSDAMNATGIGRPPRSSTTGSIEMSMVSSVSPSGVSCSQRERESSMVRLSEMQAE